MALARVKTWIAGEVLTASDLNAEYNNVLNNGADLVSPFTKAISLGGFALNFDAANTMSLVYNAKGLNLSATTAINDVFTTVASATTPDIWTMVGGVVNYTGTVTATGFAAAPQAGARRTLVCSGAAPFTAGANMLIDGFLSGATYTAAAGDKVHIIAVTTTQFRLTPVLVNTTQTLTDAAPTTWDASLGAIAVWTMAASRTISAPTNLKAGGYYVLRLSMDGTGGWAVTWNSVFKGFAGGVMPQPVSVASATTHYEFSSDGTSLFLIGYSQLRTSPIAAGKNISCRTDASVPNTKLNINYDQLVLQDANANALVVNSGALNIDFTTTGANALDTGTQQVSTWYYGWVIAKPDGTTAALGSASATAPTMPAGYTFKALVTAARSNGSTQFVTYRQTGNEVKYFAGQSALNGGTATAETSVTISSLVPPSALAFVVFCNVTGVADGSGNWDMSASMRHSSGANFFIHEWTTNGVVASAVQRQAGGEVHVPNTGAFFYLIVSTAGTSNAFSITVLGFKLPLGGE